MIATRTMRLIVWHLFALLVAASTADCYAYNDDDLARDDERALDLHCERGLAFANGDHAKVRQLDNEIAAIQSRIDSYFRSTHRASSGLPDSNGGQISDVQRGPFRDSPGSPYYPSYPDVGNVGAQSHGPSNELYGASQWSRGPTSGDVSLGQAAQDFARAKAAAEAGQDWRAIMDMRLRRLQAAFNAQPRQTMTHDKSRLQAAIALEDLKRRELKDIAYQRQNALNAGPEQAAYAEREALKTAVWNAQAMGMLPSKVDQIKRAQSMGQDWRAVYRQLVAEKQQSDAARRPTYATTLENWTPNPLACHVSSDGGGHWQLVQLAPNQAYTLQHPYSWPPTFVVKFDASYQPGMQPLMYGITPGTHHVFRNVATQGHDLELYPRP